MIPVLLKVTSRASIPLALCVALVLSVPALAETEFKERAQIEMSTLAERIESLKASRGAEDTATRERLLAEPERMPGAIEEFLRFESPISGIGRTLTTDVELHGQKMEAGKKVLLLYGAANRDERQFEEPDRFDTTRKPTQHLGFGFGTHFCLGASLARLEARVAFEELLARMPGYTADTEAAQRNPGGIRGFASLPVQL